MKKKNLTAADLAAKFGVPVTDRDLQMDGTKDNPWTGEAASEEKLAELLSPVQGKELKKTAEKPTGETAAEEPAPEPTFAELFESRSKLVEEDPAKAAGKPQVRKQTEQRKSFVKLGDDDFSAFFNMKTARVDDKDKIVMKDEDYAPFEMPEEDLKKIGKTEFHTFEDLANAFGPKKKK